MALAHGKPVFPVCINGRGRRELARKGLAEPGSEAHALLARAEPPVMLGEAGGEGGGDGDGGKAREREREERYFDHVDQLAAALRARVARAHRTATNPELTPVGASGGGSLDGLLSPTHGGGGGRGMDPRERKVRLPLPRLFPYTDDI